MTNLIDIQNACLDELPVDENQLTDWINLTLMHQSQGPSELTLRIVSKEEINELNKTYRKVDKPTNVLAFPGETPEHIELEHSFLGDIIICPSVLSAEAIEQNRKLNAHWAHIVIHGVLHLLGHNHIEDNETAIMQTLEIQLLAKLGFENPYHQEDMYLE